MDLLELKDLRRLRRDYKPTIGVYFLFRFKELVYIGQSTNVEARIASHKRDAYRRHWNGVAVIPCEDQIQALRLEAAYIKKFAPRANRQFHRRPATTHPLVSLPTEVQAAVRAIRREARRKTKTPQQMTPTEKRRAEREAWHQRYPEYVPASLTPGKGV